MINNAYVTLRAFVREHHGFGGGDFDEHPEIKNLYDKTMQEIRSFEGKKVKLVYRFSADFIGGKGEKIGRIKTEEDKIKFYEGRNRSRFNYLDAGLFDGWFATLIPLRIEALN